MFSFLRRLWRRPRSGAVRMVMYTRQGCPLWDEARQRLTGAQARHDVELCAVDVDTDPALAARFGLEVPVVAINGKVYFRGKVNAVLLVRLLHAEAARRNYGEQGARAP